MKAKDSELLQEILRSHNHESWDDHRPAMQRAIQNALLIESRGMEAECEEIADKILNRMGTGHMMPGSEDFHKIPIIPFDEKEPADINASYGRQIWLAKENSTDDTIQMAKEAAVYRLLRGLYTDVRFKGNEILKRSKIRNVPMSPITPYAYIGIIEIMVFHVMPTFNGAFDEHQKA